MPLLRILATRMGSTHPLRQGFAGSPGRIDCREEPLGIEVRDSNLFEC
jgi:hypothetical protein